MPWSSLQEFNFVQDVIPLNCTLDPTHTCLKTDYLGDIQKWRHTMRGKGWNKGIRYRVQLNDSRGKEVKVHKICVTSFMNVPVVSIGLFISHFVRFCKMEYILMGLSFLFMTSYEVFQGWGGDQHFNVTWVLGFKLRTKEVEKMTMWRHSWMLNQFQIVLNYFPSQCTVWGYKH